MSALAGAVLTGGRSSRMGTDKALVRVDGVAMAVRAAAALRAAGCDPVLAIGGDRAALSAAGLPVVADEHPGEGPLGGIITALAAGWGCVVVVACDMPWLDGETVASLVATAATTAGADVVVARTTRIEPLCALWRASALPSLRASFADGTRSVRRALDHVQVALVDVAPAALRNVNSPDDLPR